MIQLKKRKTERTVMAKKTKSLPEQTFSIRAPGALSVQLVGDFTHWQKEPINLRQEAAGLWQVGVQLQPGTHHYRFLVDGQWRDDPDCILRVANPFGSENMIRDVS